MKANKLVVELFSLAILSGCLIACSKPTKEANTQSMQNMKVNRTNSNAKSNIFADDDYDAMIDEKNSTVKGKKCERIGKCYNYFFRRYLHFNR